MKCPHCGKGELSVYDGLDIINNIAHQKIICDYCGFWATKDSNNPKEFNNSNFFTLEFSTTAGDKGKFIGTKEEIHKQIDKYKWIGYENYAKEDKLRMIAMSIDILKNGYMNEFKNNEYKKYEITIDNSFWIKISYGIW